MSLDQTAAQMVMRARQIERAVHDPGPWAVHVCGREFPARRVVGPDHVTFFALVRMEDPGVAELRCREDVVAVRELEAGHFQVAWEFAVELAAL